MDNENDVVTKKNSTNPEGTNNAQQKILTPPLSSELSIDSADKDDSTNPLLKSKQASLDLKGVENPSMNIQESSTMSPQNQTAASAGEAYDPNRIPSSIFASKPATPMEWSVASNESLFSIHMGGNNSFSRDHVFMLYKSGELPKLDEMNNSPPNFLPVIEGDKVHKKNEDFKMIEDKKSEEPAKMEPQLPVSQENEKNVTRKKASSAEEVRNSSSSTQSFQFPVLEANVGGSASVKVVMEKQTSQKKQQQQQQEAQPQAPGTPPKPAGSSWFSCFSCCSLGC